MAALLSTYNFLLWPVILAILYIGYRAALPKPLPDIPYNQDAAGKLFGDVPEMMGYVKRTKRIFVSVLMNQAPSYQESNTITVLIIYSAGSPP